MMLYTHGVIKMRFDITQGKGRVVTCTMTEKECVFCKAKERLLFSEDMKKLVCEDHLNKVIPPNGIESQFFIIDRWEIEKE